MVDDDISVVVESVHGIIAFVLDVCSHARTDKTDDDIVGFHSQCIVLQSDAIARSGLSGYGQVSVIDIERFLQFDDAAYGKYDGARSFLADCPAQGAFRTVVFQRIDDIHFPASASGGVFSGTVGSWKCRYAVGRCLYRQEATRRERNEAKRYAEFLS